MIDPDCKVCLRIGWVCENHPGRAWTEELGCQCGAGMPCACVRADGFEEPDVSQVLEERPSPKLASSLLRSLVPIVRGAVGRLQGNALALRLAGNRPGGTLHLEADHAGWCVGLSE